MKFQKLNFSNTMKRMVVKTHFALFIMLLFCGSLFAQSRMVSGVVKDPKGEPLIGVAVQIKGNTTTGTVTDVNGKFMINASANAVLIFSYIGYVTHTVSASQTHFNIEMQEDAKKLDEIVVVGYGTQKKASLTGSVAQVRGDEVLSGKATTNVAAAMQGEIPGLTVTRTSSRPGNEGISLKVRGDISVNSVNPMIIIDGIVAETWELSQINPSDIDTFSVLKDGAAAIYGTRAAGGVILITTKRGKSGKIKIAYSGSVHANVLGKRFPVASGQQFAQMVEQTSLNDYYATGAYRYWMTSSTWNKALFDDLIAGKSTAPWGDTSQHFDPYADQFDAVYGTTYGQNHSLSLSGGTDQLKVNTSISFADDRSLVKVVYDGTKKYTFRTNADYQVNKWLKTEFNTSYDNRLVSVPSQGVGQGVQDPFIFPLYNPQGQFYDQFGYNNILAKLIQGGRANSTNEIIRLGGKATIDLGFLLKGLSISGNASYKGTNIANKTVNTQITMYDWFGNVTNQTLAASTNLKDQWQRYYYKTFGGFVNYATKIKEHNITFMGGLTTEDQKYQNLTGYRATLSDQTLWDLNTADATTQTNTGGSNEWALTSFLGRFNYDYKGIYLFEFLGRRDGSSKLFEDYRWKNFLNASAGIRISELPFVKKLNVFDNLKLRVSYGETGSISGINNYDYIAAITQGTTVFGYTGALATTGYISAMTSTERTWERVANTNYAIDFATLNNRLDGTLEYYHRENRGMLINVTYPDILGATSPATNSGNFDTNGWDVNLNWKDQIGKDFSYKVGISLADSRSKVTSYPGKVAIAAGTNSIVQGRPLNAIYIYKTDGYLQTQADVDAYYPTINASGSIVPVATSTSKLIPGCVKRVDVNGDGKITTADLVYYGDANPHYSFGINIGATYKGFDFSAFFQGVGQQYVVRGGSLAYPWANWWTNQNSTYLGKTWTTENTNAEFPIMSFDGTRNTWNYNKNDINVTNCRYVRAKSIVLGYSLPKNIISKMQIDKLRVWVSGDNLFEFSNIKDGFDPESQATASQGNVDVFSRTVSVGVDVTF